jgi:hypothetical protein
VLCGVSKGIQKKNQFKIMYFGFQKDKKYILGNLPRNGLVCMKIQFCLPNNFFFLGQNAFKGVTSVTLH